MVGWKDARVVNDIEIGIDTYICIGKKAVKSEGQSTHLNESFSEITFFIIDGI